MIQEDAKSSAAGKTHAPAFGVTMFTVRTVFPEQQRVEVANFDLIPSHERGQAVCSLFLDFLAGRPAEFREQLPFLKKGEIELEWASGGGGAALASFYESGMPLSMGILLAGLRTESDGQMLQALRQIVEPVFGEATHQMMDAPERPLMVNVVFPGNPELVPQIQLLSTALASVFFRAMIEMREAAKAEAPES